MTARTVRVAIVGGGCAGLAAAWQLCKASEAGEAKKRSGGDADTYDITVYESSWRLGGKGASSRDEHGRILEHGLHVWLGFYENAFGMMRECFEHLDRNKQGRQELLVDCFDKAFVPEPHIGVASRRLSGDWQVWSGFLPPMKGRPGDPLDAETNPFTWWGYVARALALAKALMQSVLASPSDPSLAGAATTGGRSALDESIELDFAFDPLDSPNAVVERMARFLRVGALAGAAGLLQGATLLEKWLLERDSSPEDRSTILKFLEAFARQTRRQLRDVVLVDEELRRKTEIVDLIMTILVGLYKDRVFFDDRGLDKIDDIDYRDWLYKHGATRAAIDSPLVTGIYDLVFAYRDGRHDAPALSAGQALRGAMRMFFTFRGSMFWRLRAGMGDAVFAPLYVALRQKGVRFKFRHELVGIGIQDSRIDELRFRRPSVDPTDSVLDACGCWPTEELSAFGTIDDASFETEPIAEFDAVVVATGLDSFIKAFDEDDDKREQRLSNGQDKAMRRWNEMRRHVKTVATHSAQVWLDQDLADLGWQRGPVIVAGLDEEPVFQSKRKRKKQRDFETWADMTHVLASERAYRAKVKPDAPQDAARSVAYFCGVLPDPRRGKLADDDAQLAKSEAALRDLLRSGLESLWPKAFEGKRTPLDFLVAADGSKGDPTRLKAQQHIQVNCDGSARYTQSLPGSAAYRVSPLEHVYDNMTIAGDWTSCGFNGGCVEAAVMSGMLAAHAICGAPDLNRIVGYHHP